MICVTGDIHGDYARFKNKKIKKLRKGDFLIICGDFGFVWDDSSAEKKLLKKIGKKKYYTLFVDGCHENFDVLDNFPVTEKFGGKVSVISGNLMHLKRGEVFELQGKRFFAFGGGKTKETDIREDANTLFERELPNEYEISNGEINIENAGGKFDYIVTHEPPASIKEFLNFEPRQLSYMHFFFDKIKDNCEFKLWFFGKTHLNKTIPAKYKNLFDEVFVIK